MQAQLGSARDQASETWDNLEALFQSRVHKAMHQLGVPTAEEIRVLTRRVAELNATVQDPVGASRRGPSGRPARLRRKAPGPGQDGRLKRGHARRHARPPARRTTIHRRAADASGSRWRAAARSARSTRSARCTRSASRFEGLDLTDPRHVRGRELGRDDRGRARQRLRHRGHGRRVHPQRVRPSIPCGRACSCGPRSASTCARIAAIPGLAADIFKQYLRDPGKDWAEAIDPIGRLLPTGLCDNRPFERFLAQMFTGPGRTNDFRELPRSLYIVATELNSGYSVRFGEPGFDHVPISRAIQASTALPGLYPPVPIDGHTYVDGALMRTMNASLLLDEGADFVICINPLVAFDAASVPPRATAHREDLDLTHGGLPVVLSQTFRAMIQSRMLVGMRTYKQSYPNTDVLLLEPDRGDDEMFFKNVFRYADRKRLAEHAYQRTRRDLLARPTRLEPILRAARHARCGATVLEDRTRSFGAAVRERARRMQPVTGSLHRALDRLESSLHALR